MSSLSNAFTHAWKDLKTVATDVSTFLVKQQPEIQKVVNTGLSVAAVVSPSLVPVVTELDKLEESVVGALAAAAADTTQADTLANLLGELWLPFKSVVTALENHPSVTSVTTALQGVVTPSTPVVPKP